MVSRAALSYEAVPLAPPAPPTDAESATAALAYYERMKTRHTVRDFTDRPVPRAVIEAAVRTAGTAPSGANHQPWHFAAISDPALKQRIREGAEEEERAFYAGGGGDEWIKALEPLGTGAEKPHLTVAPWLIVIFAQRYGTFDDGTRFKNYYVPESVGIATGFLVAALHHAGLVCLTHTPNPMRFLNDLLGRPASEKPVMILPVGHPAPDATIPKAATLKKPLDEILSVF
ncbi:nitroreductase family protein [Oceanicola granulosus HTCC2516]|uniref:Nitroreductase family protein n=1 Tax=Oceanicola granulosus (strain ATCC BAA-861 / DSM 15982 / KCTC 12143 / HTCC2516) TaxID=314256 RepID=Q2CCW2_OCEGH|nr:nitroreductase family protein [Oceanicola granulosus]EAR50511.1 nitroreductase family protein [Oceanicola granulosus HTCC2516]